MQTALQGKLVLALVQFQMDKVQKDKLIFLRHCSSVAVLAVALQSYILASGIKALDAMSPEFQRKPTPNAMPQAQLQKYLMSKILFQVALK